MKAYSYIVRHDLGFAPNPFGRYCTLATCMPVIRRLAKKGDWIFGMGSVENVGQGKLIYAMRVDEVLTLKQYSEDRRFKSKIPDMSGPIEKCCGDSIYYQSQGWWYQRPSYHTAKHMNHDLSGLNVLVSRHFFYFGAQAVEVRSEFGELVCRGRGHRCRFDEHVVEAFVDWIEKTYVRGKHGLPYDFQGEEPGCKPEASRPSGTCKPKPKRKSGC